MYFLAKTSFKSTVRALSIVIAVLGMSSTHATTVQIQTVLGDFEVNLYDKATPETVANFLAYVNSDAYEDTVVHRSVKKNSGAEDFVIQSGGYSYTGTFPLSAVAARRDVDDIDVDGNTTETLHPINEPKYSNVRGTIAMAKQDGDASSATSQWFINLSDNSEDIDNANGGFTVFGQVTGNGMAIVDAIAALNRFNMGGALNSIPLRDYTPTDVTNNTPVTGSHLVTIDNIVVLNASPDTADGLTPTPNTLVGKSSDDDDSSGSLGLLSLLLLGVLSLSRMILPKT